MVSYIIISVVGIVMLALDQITKAVITANVAPTESIEVIKDFFSVVNWRNTGAAWGIFSNSTILLAILSILVAGFVLFAYTQARSNLLKLSMMLVVSGAAGNLIDRLSPQHSVVDFLHFYNLFGSIDFPAFNVADICVTAGCIGVILYLIFFSRKTPAFRQGTVLAKFFSEKEEKKAENE